eukprot:2013284-Prymnesium_polylepis.1
MPQRTASQATSPFTCTITVYWNSQYGIAPLEISAATLPNQKTTYRRWVVVQLPPSKGRSTKAKRSFPPVMFGDLTQPVASGWICYQAGDDVRVHMGARTFGRSAPGVQKDDAPRRRSEAVEPKATEKDSLLEQYKSKLLEKELTIAPLDSLALGRLADVQRQLAVAAGSGLPLHKADVMPEADATAMRLEREARENYASTAGGRRDSAQPGSRKSLQRSLEEAMQIIPPIAGSELATATAKGTNDK